MQGFEGLTVVISGGASGIGAAAADAFAARGANAAVLDLNKSETHWSHKCDVADDNQVRLAVAAVKEHFGGIDIVVNNAGIGAVGTVEENSDKQWFRVLDVNLLGMVRLSRACLPHLRESTAPAIVNTTSIAATAGLVKRALYSASKGAVHSLTLAMAADHVSEGIRVNCVSPGTADTPWVQRLLEQAEDPAAERRDDEANSEPDIDAGMQEIPVEIPQRPGDLAACEAADDRDLGEIAFPNAAPEDSRLTEVSGLAASRTQPIVWVHDDSGNEPNVYALSLGNEGIADGTPLAIFRLPGVAVRDWEDMAIGPGAKSGADYIYLGDIGDKNREALGSDIVVYRFEEPRVQIPTRPLGGSPPEASVSMVPEFDSLRANYPAGLVENADALFVDALGGRAPDLYIVTSGNGITTPNRLFRMSTGSPSETVTMEYVTSLFGGEAGDPEVTGADMSPDGRLIVIRTLHTAAIWTRAGGASMEEVFAELPCAALIPAGDAESGEGGAIGFSADSRGYFTSIEGDPAPLWFVSMSEH